jgi:uncharacterized coiled-coil protein SlyX
LKLRISFRSELIIIFFFPQTDSKEVAILDQETAIHNLKATILDKEKTIEQFREKVNLLTNKLKEYRVKEQTQLAEAGKLTNKSLELESQNLQLKAQMINYEALSIAEQLRKFEASQANKQLSIFKVYNKRRI